MCGIYTSSFCEVSHTHTPLLLTYIQTFVFSPFFFYCGLVSDSRISNTTREWDSHFAKCMDRKWNSNKMLSSTNYFDIVAGVLQGDILSPYLFIICLDYVLWKSTGLMKENGFTLAKIPHTNYYGRGLRRWHSASGKYTRSSWIPAI